MNRSGQATSERLLPSSGRQIHYASSCLATRITVARDTPCSRESSLIEAPALCPASTSARCSAVVAAGGPNVLPCCFARGSPACVRSTRRSRSSSVTAASIVFPAGEARSRAQLQYDDLNAARRQEHASGSLGKRIGILVGTMILASMGNQATFPK